MTFWLTSIPSISCSVSRGKSVSSMFLPYLSQAISLTRWAWSWMKQRSMQWLSGLLPAKLRSCSVFWGLKIFIITLSEGSARVTALLKKKDTCWNGVISFTALWWGAQVTPCGFLFQKALCRGAKLWHWELRAVGCQARPEGTETPARGCCTVLTHCVHGPQNSWIPLNNQMPEFSPSLMISLLHPVTVLTYGYKHPARILLWTPNQVQIPSYHHPALLMPSHGTLTRKFLHPCCMFCQTYWCTTMLLGQAHNLVPHHAGYWTSRHTENTEPCSTEY